MKKEEIKKLCEADGKLEWWAMLLFAEIGSIVQEGDHSGYEPKILYPLVVNKVKEFELLVIKVALEKADEVLSMNERVARLEKAAGITPDQLAGEQQ